MRYSIEPRDKIYVKAYGCLSFVKNIGTNATKTAENMSNKYSQKPLDSAKKSTTDAIKTAPNRVIQKTAEGTGGLNCNIIADKITNLSKKFHKMIKLIKKWKYQTKDMYLQKKDNKLLMN